MIDFAFLYHWIRHYFDHIFPFLMLCNPIGIISHMRIAPVLQAIELQVDRYCLFFRLIHARYTFLALLYFDRHLKLSGNFILQCTDFLLIRLRLLWRAPFIKVHQIDILMELIVITALFLIYVRHVRFSLHPERLLSFHQESRFLPLLFQ